MLRGHFQWDSGIANLANGESQKMDFQVLFLKGQVDRTKFIFSDNERKYVMWSYSVGQWGVSFFQQKAGKLEPPNPPKKKYFMGPSLNVIDDNPDSLTMNYGRLCGQ